MTWRATVLTLFPEMFPGPLGVSLAGKALASGLWELEARDIRISATDKHRSVDDTPAGIRGVDRRRQHVGPQHHAGPATGRSVIDAAMLVGGRSADIARLKLPQARRQRLARQANAERPGKHLGEERENGGAPGHIKPIT